MKKYITFVIIVLFAGTASGWVCRSEHWLIDWMLYPGFLPNSTPDPPTSVIGNPNWSVFANLGGGVQTMYGDGWCGPSNINPPSSAGTVHTSAPYCWCRMTAPKTGKWIFLYGEGLSLKNDCPGLCSYDCVRCVLQGTQGTCNRGILLDH